jgi:hypothetical protein
MTTELKARSRNYWLTSFGGGAKRGRCIQVTAQQEDGKFGYIQLNRNDAKALIKDLKTFLKDN